MYTRGLLPWPLVRATGLVGLFLLAFRPGVAGEDAPEIEAPWEPEDLPVADPPRPRPPPPTLLKSLAPPAIQFYRRHIATQSTGRCPFHISCSHFAEQAVERFGLVRGVALFIDRHYFREHAGAVHLYPLRETWRDNRIRLKLDDSFFLSGKRGVAE